MHLLQEANNIIDYKGPLIILIVVVLIGLSSAIYVYSHDKYSLLYYNDAVSHLVKAREFIDSARPGLLQQMPGLAGWLPLPHLLLLPFSLLDPLFKSGFAGLLVSLPSFAITSVLLFRLINSQIRIPYIAMIGALLYASNRNIIYLGITPMTESPFMLFFVASAYFLQKWLRSYHQSSSPSPLQNTDWTRSPYFPFSFFTLLSTYFPHQLRNLTICSILLSVATLCRYEGWILPIFLVSFVIVAVIRNRGHDTKYKVLAILVSALSFSGMALWITYNTYYYGDPLKFSNGPWSAASQAVAGGNRSHLYLQPVNVLYIYTLTALAMYGPILLVTALIGYIFHRYLDAKQEQVKRRTASILCIYFALPAVMTILSMIAGIGEMNQGWFNSRFLILISPIIIILVSIFLLRLPKSIRKCNFTLASIIASLFVYQLIIPSTGVVTFVDARDLFFSASRPFSIIAAGILGSVYHGGMILIITGSAQQNKIMQESGIPLRNFDTTLESNTWNASFKQPWLHDNYIVISKKPDLSAANVAKYWLDRQPQLNKYFKLAYEDQYYRIMIK